MNVNEIINKVHEVSLNTEYWFVRTEHGSLFEKFYEGNYIAIGWDYISIYEMRNSEPTIVKEKIASKEGFDLSTPSGRSNATSVYNKINTFLNLKKGDIVLIPSRNTDRIAFGEIRENKAYDDLKTETFIKRRKVKWIKVSQMGNLNPIFYQVKSNHHAISNINKYSTYIDREIGNLFRKDDNTHYVLKIEKEENIEYVNLSNLLDNIDELLNVINSQLQFDENSKNFYVKINLQSKGALEIIKDGKSLAVLAYLLFLSSCGNLDNEQDKKIRTLINNNKTLIENTTKSIDSLEVNLNELTKPFENGN